MAQVVIIDLMAHKFIRIIIFFWVDLGTQAQVDSIYISQKKDESKAHPNYSNPTPFAESEV